MAANGAQIAQTRASVLGPIRAFGVMSGGPAVLGVLATIGLGSTLHALVTGKRPRGWALAAIAGTAAYLIGLRPWTRSWGTTSAEVGKALPGDELVPTPGIEMMRAVTVNAPVDAVWPWLAQIGQDRGGFYSYSWLENLAGCNLQNADRIHEEWQHREVGETVLLHPATGPKLARFEPNRSYAFDGGWYFALEPIDVQHTRLFARTRVPRGFPSFAYAIFIELPHFIMERRMLFGIKQRAERPTTTSLDRPFPGSSPVSKGRPTPWRRDRRV